MKFAPFSRLLRYEFRRFKGLSALALVFILLIPILYGGIYLAANWDLYNHTDRLKIAVVNLDKGAEYKGEKVDGGTMFEDALRSQDNFDWQFLGTDAHGAHDGLSEGTYYMVMTIPANFSERLTSAGAFTPERAQISLERDDANGFIAGILTSQIDNALTATLDSSISQTYFTALFTNLEDIRAGMDTASEGSRSLHDHLDEVREGVSQLDTAVKGIDISGVQSAMGSVPDAFSSFDSAVTGFNSAASDIESGATQIAGAGQTMKTSATDIATHLQTASSYLKEDVPALGGQLQQIGIDVNNLAGAGQNSPIGQSVVGVKTAQASAAALAQSHPELANDPAFQSLTAALATADTNTGAVSTGVGNIANTLQSIDLQTSATKLQGALEGIGQADSNLAGAGNDLVSGLTSIQKGGQTSKDVLSGVNQNVESLRSTTAGLSAQGGQLNSGIQRLSQALDQLDEAMPQLVQGADDLSTGLTEGAEQIPALSETERENMSAVMSSPIDVHQVVDNPAKYYGRGLAPMFFSLGLWIATISTFLVVRTISGRALTGRARPGRIATFGFGPVAAIGLAGALIMGLVLWPVLGINPVHPWLYVLLLLVTAISFMALAYVVRLGLGAIQTAIFLVALILQLPACGGTFPIAMLNPFWQALAVISPMRYSVDAFRVAISGGNMAVYWGSLAVLALIAVLSIVGVVLLIRRRQLFRMRDLHPPLVTGSSTGDNAFMVRPR